MLVADDARNLYALTSLLRDHRVTVIPATSAREALEALEAEHDVDLAFMDVMMPETDGLEAVRAKMGRICKLAALRIVALTAKATESDRAVFGGRLRRLRRTSPVEAGASSP